MRDGHGPAMVAHEVAHVVAEERGGNRIGHGPKFRETYVECLRALLGDDWADRLADAFVERYKGRAFPKT